KVFSEQEAQCFPLAREEDHVINLKEGAPETLNCKTYPLSPKENQELDEFLDEHLKKGYIWESKSPYMSPFFFVKKKDGKLQPVQGYQKLNEHIIRDTYPLPLIQTILEQLQGKTLFTKFNVQWGYNNIQIKEEDIWKAVFKMPRIQTKSNVLWIDQ